MKKIFFVTGSRAEFGIFENFLKILSKQANTNLSLIVTGSFLEVDFKNDFKDIIKSKLRIKKKIKLNLSKKKIFEKPSLDISIGIKKFTLLFKKERPDYIMIPCDRYEMLAPSFSAFFLKIPIIHFYGGDTTMGSFDNIVRDQISLMSQYHFVSNKHHAKKIINLGINKSKIFNVGALGLDKLDNKKIFSKNKIKNIFKNFFSKKTALVTFHPVTNGNTKLEFKNLIKALEKKDYNILFTGPNNDPEKEIILSEIKSLVKKDPKKYFHSRHLGRNLYFSFVKNVDFNIGNSSSLLHEVPLFKKISINVGYRQNLRVAGPSVIHTEAKTNLILKTFNNKKFKSSFHNPYFKKNSINNTINIIKNLI